MSSFSTNTCDSHAVLEATDLNWRFVILLTNSEQICLLYFGLAVFGVMVQNEAECGIKCYCSKSEKLGNMTNDTDIIIQIKTGFLSQKWFVCHCSVKEILYDRT